MARSNTWLTPRPILQAVGPFDLDPCAAPEPRPWPTARVHYAEADGNGLTRPWFGLVWCNPPYQPNPGPWLSRLAEHGAGMALVFARTDADWFFKTVWDRCAAALFLRGRLRFHFPDGRPGPGNGGAPSVLVAYGRECFSRIAKADVPGKLLVQDGVIILEGPAGTWREVVVGVLSGNSRRLREIYALAESTPRVRRAKSRGHNWQAQVRRALQVYCRPVEKGMWAPRRRT